MNSQQLVLPLQTVSPKTFSNFTVGDNTVVVDAVRSAAKQLSFPGGFTYLYGDQSTGKTHLLLACVGLAMEQQLAVHYVDLHGKFEFTPITEKLNQAALICVDHLDSIAGDEQAEKDLLSLIEHVRNNGGSLIAAGRQPSSHLAINLPDLLSRLSAWPSYGLSELSEGEKQQVLKDSAKQKGFELSAEVTSWMLTHQSRDLGFLLDFLDRIDTLSLVQKRRVTVPLIKTLR